MNEAPTLYQKYEALQRERGVTTYAVCKQTGLETSMMSRWKSGAYQPKIDKLKAIADYFDVPVTYFIE